MLKCAINYVNNACIQIGCAVVLLKINMMNAQNIFKEKNTTENVSLTKIYNTVIDVVVYGFNISEYYKNSFVYKIYCKLATLHTNEPKKQIAIIGGFKGKKHELSVDKAIEKYNLFYQNDKLFEKVSKACISKLEES